MSLVVRPPDVFATVLYTPAVEKNMLESVVTVVAHFSVMHGVTSGGSRQRSVRRKARFRADDGMLRELARRVEAR